MGLCRQKKPSHKEKIEEIYLLKIIKFQHIQNLQIYMVEIIKFPISQRSSKKIISYKAMRKTRHQQARTWQVTVHKLELDRATTKSLTPKLSLFQPN